MFLPQSVALCLHNFELMVPYFTRIICHRIKAQVDI